MVSRRRLLVSGGALTLAWHAAPISAAVAAAGGSVSEHRFALLILRGGMDGLAAVPAYGDAAYRKARGRLADPLPNEEGDLLDLDGFFGLHPRFQRLHELYRAKELAVVHAVAPPYRERSHFDGQDVLETGVPEPSGSTDGWLSRALSIAPGNPRHERYAMALGGAVPRVLQGARPVGSWAPDRLPRPDDDTLARVLRLYGDDAILGPRLDAALKTEEMAGALDTGGGGGDALTITAKAAAEFLKSPEGPRVAVMESGGWDTHANQQGQLANRFRGLDAVVGGFRDALGEAWSTTVLVMVTEFGRTVAMNGTRGTDHGVGGAAFVAGGPVRGGRVLAEWPGLEPGSLYQGRDLRPSTDIRSIFKTVLVGHLGFDANAVDELVFPDERMDTIGDLFSA